MIIAVDYDGTLFIDGKANEALIRRLSRAQRQGNTVILWTRRAGDRLRQAVENLSAYGLRPNYVNANAPESIKALGYDPRKILADVYIDDKNG